MEIQLRFSFVLSLPLYLISSREGSGREVSFNNINLCEGNALQIYELIFCDSEKLVTHLLRKKILILFSNLPISYL